MARVKEIRGSKVAAVLYKVSYVYSVEEYKVRALSSVLSVPTYRKKHIERRISASAIHFHNLKLFTNCPNYE